MPKYLIQASYTREGVHGLLKEGGSSRIETVTELIKGMGGTVEAFYFAFGATMLSALSICRTMRVLQPFLLQ